MKPEEHTRLEQIREGNQPWRKTAYELGDIIAGYESDVDFLLSIVKGQEAPTTFYNEDGSYNPIGKNIADHAADQMRSLCVEKVKEYGKKHQLCHPLRARAAIDLVEILESLTLQDQEAKQL